MPEPVEPVMVPTAAAPIADRYQLRTELGRGTTGRVYLAHDLHLDRLVAVKVLNQQMLNDQEVLSRFDEEIRLTAKLQHPGIVNVFEAARTPDGLPCYVMTLARGKTMDELLDRLRASPDPWREMPLVERLTLFLKILEVLAYTHSQGVVHRDLKPANIVIGEYGEAWVLDWGLARAVRDDPVIDDDLVADDVLAATTSYSALEPSEEETRHASQIRAAESDRQRAPSDRQRPTSDRQSQPQSQANGRSDRKRSTSQRSLSQRSTSQRSVNIDAATVIMDGDTERERQASDRLLAVGASEGEAVTKIVPAITAPITLVATPAAAITAAVTAAATAARRASAPPGAATSGDGDTSAIVARIDTTQITADPRPDSDRIEQLDPPHTDPLDQVPTTRRDSNRHHTTRFDQSGNPTTRHAHRSGTLSAHRTATGSHTSARIRVSSGRFATGSRVPESQRLARATHQGQVLGSPAYMSPEQGRGNSSEADQRTDIYSLGAMLMELLCLHTPVESQPSDSLGTLLQRVREGKRTKVIDHWKDAPPALNAICEGALAFDPQNRYPTCEVFERELRQLLTQLSASYAELERQRLEKERQEAWLPGGMWDFGASRSIGPFETASVAVGAEQVGQVHHPELGGVLLGGYGLQSYPLALKPGDDVRLTVQVSVLRGGEFWVCVRGAPPNASYQFRIGAFGGRWLAIARADGPSDVLVPTLLSLTPMRERATGVVGRESETSFRVVVESAGSRLRLLVEGQEALEVHDVQPLGTGDDHHLAVATNSSQVVVRQLMVERRRSPLLVPMHLIGHELLRQGLNDQAIAFYRSFLASHGDSHESAPARFMLAMSLAKVHRLDEAEAELRGFLDEHFDHTLAQDAIFQLACLRLTIGGGIRKAVQEILSYQEAGDVVRTRFCLWMIPLLQRNVLDQGITDDQEFDLRLIGSMLRGSPDESPVKQTLAQVLGMALRQYLNRAVDADDQPVLSHHRERVRRVTQLGYRLSIRDQRLISDYEDLADHLKSVSEPEETLLCLGRADDNAVILGDWVRDVLALDHLGCRDQILAAFSGEDLLPMERLVRAALRHKHGDQTGGIDDLTWCFRLTDVLETERTSLVILNCARLGCYGLGYLPWELVEEGLHTIHGNLLAAPLMAGAATLAESLGHRDVAASLYQQLAAPGSGFRLIGEQGLARLMGGERG